MTDDELPDKIGDINPTETPCPNCGETPVYRVNLFGTKTSRPEAIACPACNEVRKWPEGGAS